LWLNLVGNAVGVSAAGARVTLESMRLGNSWRFVVADEGPGLPPDQWERIFKRFVRYEHESAPSRGHGLGLAICRSIVDLHGGQIRAGERNTRANKESRTGPRAAAARIPDYVARLQCRGGRTCKPPTPDTRERGIGENGATDVRVSQDCAGEVCAGEIRTRKRDAR
jgi:hypothetical protein